MKNVFLLLDGHPSRDHVPGYFARANASVHTLDLSLSDSELAGQGPELFVLSEEHATPTFSTA